MRNTITDTLSAAADNSNAIFKFHGGYFWATFAKAREDTLVYTAGRALLVGLDILGSAQRSLQTAAGRLTISGSKNANLDVEIESVET